MHIILEIINCYLENKIMRERMMMGEDVCVYRQADISAYKFQSCIYNCVFYYNFRDH